MLSFHFCHRSHFAHGPKEEGLDDRGKWLANIHRMCPLLPLIIKSLFWSVCHLVGFQIRHKYRYSLLPLWETHPHTPSPDFFVTSLPFLFLPIPNIQPRYATAHVVSIDPYFWPSLPPDKANYQMYSKFCLLEDFPLALSFGVTLDWYYEAERSTLGGVTLAYISITSPTSPFSSMSSLFSGAIYF